MKTTTVLIACRAQASGEAVRQLLESHAELDVSLGVVADGHADPLHGLRRLPDVMILLLEDHTDEMLRALAARATAERPPTIVVAPQGDPNLMRRAMQIGARDYFSPPLNGQELFDSIRQIRNNHEGPETPAVRGTLIAVINAKGGSGASTIAANLAHLRAVQTRSDVALVDLDLQFGTLPLSFDVTPQHSLLDMLHDVGRLDDRLLREYSARHGSGVAIFSAMSDQIPLPWEQSAQALRQFLEATRRVYGTVVADLPRQIDPLTTTVLEQADRVVIVMQQSLAHIRDTKRILRILGSGIAVPSDNITVVVNRYAESNNLSEREITDAIGPTNLFQLPNDFKTVSEALNVGVPLQELNKNAPITRALADLLAELTRTAEELAKPPSKKRGLRALFGGT